MSLSSSIEFDSGRTWKACLLIAILTVVFSGLFDHDIWTPDEPRVAAIVHNMYLTGDYVIPRIATMAFVEKPPVFFVASALVMHATGLDAVMAGRLALALFCLGSLAASFRIAYLLNGEKFAWLTLAVVATLEGFIQNFHWLRADAALMVTTIAAVWAFTEAYLRQKHTYLLIAGVITGLAFLSKGPIAIIFVGLAWVPLFLRALHLRKLSPQEAVSISQFALMHLVGIALMCLVAASWIYPFYQSASPELWREWYWVNQVGRLTGTATASLGHDKTGEHFYYVFGIIEYTLPWTPLLVLWLGAFIYKLRSPQQLRWTDGFFAFWFLPAIFVLSYSVTKRAIYLAPLTPLFGLMIADALYKFSGKWFDWYRKAWIALTAFILIACAAVPLWVEHLPAEKIPPPLMEWLTTWQVTALIPVLAVVLMILTETRPWPQWSKMAIVTALFFASVYSYLSPAVDIAKDMKPDLEAFVGQIPEERRDKIAGLGFTETMGSIFFLYHDWGVPQVDSERAQRILDGADPEFDSLLLDRYNSLSEITTYAGFRPDTKYEILAQGTPRSNKVKDTIFWLSPKQN
jgi:4-amino-4-deoxy-L-arabinose transferase-like glycosyltransferase